MNWFFNLKIRNKILIAFLALIIFSMTIGLIGIYNLKKIDSLGNQLYLYNTQPIGFMNTIQVNLQKNRVLVRDMIIENDMNKNSLNRSTLIQNDKEIDKAMEDFKATIQSQEVTDEYNNLKSTIDKYRPTRDRIIDLAVQNKNQEAIDIMNGEGAVLAKSMDDSAARMIDLKESQAKDKSETNTKTAASATFFMIGIIILGTAIALVFAIIISRLISKPINKVLFIIKEMSKGHLGERMNLDTADEIGEMAKVMDAFAEGLQTSVIGTMNKIAKGDISVDIHFNDEKDEISPALKKMVENVKGLVTDATMLAQAAIEGKLDTRADASKHSGDFKKIVEGVNELIDAMVKPIREVNNVIGEMSKGNLAVSIRGDYKGEFGVLADTTNYFKERLKNIIEEISEVTGKISAGDLVIERVKEYKGDFNSISVSLNKIVDSLNEVLSEINAASEQVNAGAGQVSDGSQALAKGATEQASAIEELTAAITQVAAQTKENSDNAKQAKELALKVKESAEVGNVHMSEMLKSMGEINESSSSISKIIKVIDEIAFQTNILALNAAVEAARAGQHGKGFAVVAEEVRNLAARSANAAKETTDLIEGSIRKSEKGTEIANNTAKALYEIVEGVSKAAALVTEIAAASEEQATGINQVDIGIEQVSQVVQTNSATSEESAAASEELSSQAELLKEMVANFKLKNSINSMKRTTEVKNYDIKNNMAYKEAAVTLSKSNLDLSDNEFGKY